MSTKNLARTVIEGGRSSWAQSARRAANFKYRHGVRTKLAVYRAEAEMTDGLTFPILKKDHRDFDDKLGPPRRWLASQVGRPWDIVRSELFRRFDTRTTAGRHIVFCHMLNWVTHHGAVVTPFCRRPFFRVDRRGILRHAPARPNGPIQERSGGAPAGPAPR